jgi:hypothetical protein
VNEEISRIKNFEIFLETTLKFKPLNIFEEKKKTIILIRELPNTKNKSEKNERDELLIKYLSSPKKLVIIIQTLYDTISMSSLVYKEFPIHFLSSIIKFE